MSNSFQSHGLRSPPGSSVPGTSQARILEWVLLQGIFPIQGLNSGLLHCRQILNCREPPGKPSPELSFAKTLTTGNRSILCPEDLLNQCVFPWLSYTSSPSRVSGGWRWLEMIPCRSSQDLEWKYSQFIKMLHNEVNLAKCHHKHVWNFFLC